MCEPSKLDVEKYFNLRPFLTSLAVGQAILRMQFGIIRNGLVFEWDEHKKCFE